MNHGEEETVEADIISKEKVRQHTLLYCNTGAHLIMCSSFLVQYDSVIEVVCHYSDFLIAHSLYYVSFT